VSGADQRRVAGGARATALFAVGVAGGIVAGMMMWGGAMGISRRSLYSTSPLARFAALGALVGRRGVDVALVLRDYVRWETRPGLRRRGERMLRALERDLN